MKAHDIKPSDIVRIDRDVVCVDSVKEISGDLVELSLRNVARTITLHSYQEVEQLGICDGYTIQEVLRM